MKLNERKVLITGASSGLGQEIAKILINKYNCQVLGVARNEQKLIQFKNDLGEKSQNFDYYIMDVSIEENWHKLHQKLTEESRVIEILINNAGIMLPFKSADKTETSEVERVMKINYFSVVYACKTFIPMLIGQKNPAIINIGSLASLCCLPGVAGYSASKAALKSYSEALSVELGKNIFVSTVMPGFVRTNLMSGAIAEGEEKIINKVARPAPKVARIIVRKMKHNCRRMILGADAKAMFLFYRYFPRSSGRVAGSFLRLTKIKTLQNIYTDKNDYCEATSLIDKQKCGKGEADD
ncbi:MAG: SDR family NAD(P)-dependent oxidoreductase [Christensenellaceae bacterium]|jgi:short-subunit dehydrogenase|nr:SDR family NAD(P)-dependent oxidoreductase [Christensenellaceae bacterium]